MIEQASDGDPTGESLSFGVRGSPLQGPTPAGWAEVALRDFDAFLLDHASCERKATANAMALVSKFSHEPRITEPMVALAREELEHFLQVYRIAGRRGLILGQDEKDPYVNDLMKAMRFPPAERLLDRLIVSCLIEARSAERFTLVAAHLEDAELKAFYTDLARTEAGHFRIFLKMADRLYSKPDVEEALVRLSSHEHDVMLRTPWRNAVH